MHIMKCLNINRDVRTRETLELYDKLMRFIEIPRIKLMVQPRRNEGETNEVKFQFRESNRKYLHRIVEDIASVLSIPQKISIRIKIAVNNDNLDPRKYELALASLVLAILLGGTGSIKGRGFGSLVLKNVKPGSKFKNSAEKIIGALNKVLQARNGRELQDNLHMYIKYVLNLASQIYCKEGACQQTEMEYIPRVPTLSRDPDYFKLYVSEVRSKKSITDILEGIGKAVLKSEWKRKYGNVRMSGREFHTWILGLPRSVKNTGYYIDTNERGRRPSAINFKILENNQKKRFVVIYGFLSRDWPLNNLYHVSKGFNRAKRVTDLNIIDIIERKKQSCKTSEANDEKCLATVFNVAFKSVTNLIKRRLEG